MTKPKQLQWKSEEVFENIYKKVLNFLSYKERTLSELDAAVDKYLYRISLPKRDKEDLKEKVLAELGEEFLVSDDSYVKDYILECIQLDRLVSRQQITQFLYKKGITQEIITDGLEKYYTPEVEEKIVISLCEKRMRSTTLPDKAKMTRYLLSKGFSPSVVYPVVDTKFKRI